MIATAQRAVRMWTAYRRRRFLQPNRIAVRAKVADGHVDHLTIHDDGTVAAEGWARDLVAFRQMLTLRVGERTLSPAQAYRKRREDAATLLTSRTPFVGAVVEWIVDPSAAPRSAALLRDAVPLVQFALPAMTEPAYAHLRTEPRVLGRGEIYGFGPPVPEVSIEIVELARALPPPILDFGCGAGALVRELRREGLEAYGLELDTERIRRHLLPEVQPFVTLYDGRLPAPFADGAFASVTCAEVLEHMADAAAALGEMARLARRALFVTVPDMSAIPRGFHHGVVPWHLLESTHLNFFTQRSLEQALAPHAATFETARIGLVQCDRLQYYTSLAATVRLK